METRKESGRAIAFERPEDVRQLDGRTWSVKGSRPIPYRVDTVSGGCTCPDSQNRRPDDPTHRCKHAWAVWFTAMEPAVYKAKPWPNGVWSIAITRMGVEFTRFGLFETEEQALAAIEGVRGVSHQSAVA